MYADPNGALAAVQQTLSWYPDRLWRWMMACQWHRLAQEEAFVARTAEVGDHPGSAVTAARLVRDIVRLALLMDRVYAPYQKWLGTAFAAAAHHHDDGLETHLDAAVGAVDATAREATLGAAYQVLGRRHNSLRLTPPVDPSVGDYFARPARVLMADRFTQVLLDDVTEPNLRALPLIGSVEQAMDSVDVLSVPAQFRQLAALYPGL